MKKWIYFGCVVTFFALNYSVDVKLKNGSRVENLFFLNGSRISYLICFFASAAALSVLLERNTSESDSTRRKMPSWSEIPKWPFLAFLPLMATSSWSQDGYMARDGVITIQHGWFMAGSLGVYLAVVATVILVEVALQRRAGGAPRAESTPR